MSTITIRTVADLIDAVEAGKLTSMITALETLANLKGMELSHVRATSTRLLTYHRDQLWPDAEYEAEEFLKPQHRGPFLRELIDHL